MKLKILNPPRSIKSETILISKTGVIRVNSKIAQKFKFDRKDKWILALDEEDKYNKHLYFLKAKEEYDGMAKKMLIINDSWVFQCPQIINELKLKSSLRCNYTNFELDGMKGFCLMIN